MTLHIITKVISSEEEKDLIRTSIQKEDDCLFIQSGVYNCLNKSVLGRLTDVKARGFYVLSTDQQSRGVQILHPEPIQAISMKEFVELSVKHTKSITW